METKKEKKNYSKRIILFILLIIGLSYISYHTTERIMIRHEVNTLKKSIKQKEDSVIKYINIDVNSMDLMAFKNRIDSLKLDSLLRDSLKSKTANQAFLQNLNISIGWFIYTWEQLNSDSPNNQDIKGQIMYSFKNINDMSQLNTVVLLVANSMAMKMGMDALSHPEVKRKELFDKQCSIFIRTFSKYNVFLSQKYIEQQDLMIKRFNQIQYAIESGQRFYLSDLNKITKAMKPIDDLKRDPEFLYIIDSFFSSFIEFIKLEQQYN